MWNAVMRSRFAGLVLAATALAAGSGLPGAAHAGTAQIVQVEQGGTPFIAYAGAFYYNGTIASIGYSILPKSGSLTRALGATYSAAYLAAHNLFIPGSNAVVIPVFGLYSGTANSVTITYTFTDGTTSAQATTINTPTYTDPCPQVAQRTFLQLRPSTSSLNYDYFMLKDYCSTNAPAIIDTDNNIRWAGNTGGGAESIGFFNNAFYFSDLATGIKRIDLTNGQVSTVANYANIGVTATNQHNIDPGRNGLLVEVNTTAQLEAAAIEINPATGAVLQSWDFGAIISATMTAGGDTPAKFVLGTTADWFHNNALAYNPKDNTLIVSSRENFVMAVDYDAPASGQRQIHWILGDTTKLWHSFPSLAKLALAPVNGSLPPVGQHAVSIDHNGNVFMFDDGLGSLTNTPAGITRNYSAARAYQINTAAMSATEVFTFTASNAGANLFSPICGSAYDVGGSYLVDFTTANAAAAQGAQANQTPGTIVNTLLAAGNTTAAVLVGVGSSKQIEFVIALQSPTPCSPGWNALPFATNVFTFN